MYHRIEYQPFAEVLTLLTLLTLLIVYIYVCRGIGVLYVAGQYRSLYTKNTATCNATVSLIVS